MKQLYKPDKPYKLDKLLSSAFFYFSILLFLIGFNFADAPMQSGWYQQFLPNIGNRGISDICFIDSLNGWAVTPYVAVNDTVFVLRTTNGGDNWFKQFTGTAQFPGMNRIKFLNINTGFCCGNRLFNGSTQLVKTTNGGYNWFSLNTPDPFETFHDMNVYNEDTIWLVSSNSPTGGVFRTINGGANWDRQLDLGSQNPSHIYMFNGNIGFISKNTGSSYVRKTTNGGFNWDTIVNNEGFVDMYFADALTGWKAFDSVKKTTNGGLNWQAQILPYGGIVSPFSRLSQFSTIDNDTIWGVGGYVVFPNNQVRGILYRTSNGGINWLFQIPDTALIKIAADYHFVDFVSMPIGWAYYSNRGIHTTTGGDPIWYMGVVQKSNEVPISFVLKQNYPNPFNPRTVIPYSLRSPAYVRLIAYDVTGKEVQRMVDQKQDAGEYEVDFMGKFASTGVYFYRMEVTDDKSQKLYTDTKKMLLLK